MEVFGIQIDLNSLLEVIVPVVLKIGLLVLAFVILVPIGKKVIEKAINKAGSNQKISPSRVKTLEKLLLNLFSYVMFFVFILMLFGVFGIPLGPLLAGAGIVGLAIGFGAQGLVSDVVTGFFILLERQLEIDDYVTTAGYDGIVEEIGLRTSKIRSFDGTLNYVPNRYIEGVANHTRGNMRALVDISIRYDDNVDEAITVLEQVCTEFKKDDRFKEGPDAIGVQSFGSSNIVLRVVGQTENGLQWECERAMRQQIKAAFNNAEIETPFPEPITVHNDQG